jgi:hypothetical protein
MTLRTPHPAGAHHNGGQPPSPTPQRCFAPKRPPEQERVTAIAAGCTRTAVGDLLLPQPLMPTLPRAPGCAAGARILRGAEGTCGTCEYASQRSPTGRPEARAPGIPYGQNIRTRFSTGSCAPDMIRPNLAFHPALAHTEAQVRTSWKR